MDEQPTTFDSKELIAKALKDFTIADIERASAYGHDFENGFRKLHTFAQGVTVFGSARITEDSKYYQKARELGQLLANNGHTVLTGGGPGIMEAANRGAFEYGGHSIGFNITLPHEQHASPYLTDMVEFKYFFARKVMLVMASKAYVCFPGGFGTLDELSEVLVLMQEGKMPKMPLFLYGKSFWKPFDRVFAKTLLGNKFIAAKDLKIYTITDDLNDIVKAANKIGHPKISENYYDTFGLIKHNN